MGWHARLWVAYIGALELGRVSTLSDVVPLLPLATSLLFVALVKTSGSKLLVAGTSLVVTVAWASGIHAQPLPAGLVLACANAVGALVGAQALVQLGGRLGLRSVFDTVATVAAGMFAAGAAAGVVLLGDMLAGQHLALDRAHVRLVTDVVAFFVVVPLVMAGRRGLAAAVSGRAIELIVLLASVVAATHFMWSSSTKPWPGLLAPFFAWGILRFPVASGLVNTAFQLTAFAHLRFGRGAAAIAAGATDGLAGLWLHAIVCAAFLVMSAGVLERRRAQQLMARVLDGVSDGIIVLDPRGQVRTMNRAAASMFGHDQRTAGELSHLTLWTEGPPDASVGSTQELTGRHADGTEFPARVTFAPVPADDEHHTLAVVRDLSRQRQTEQSLAMSEAQWEAVVAALTDVILIHDRSGCVLAAHVAPRAVEELDGHPLVGHRIADMMTAEEARPIEVARARVLATRRPQVLEQQVTWGGRPYWAEMRIVPLGTDKTLSILRDVTKGHVLQDQLRQSQRLEAIGRLAGGVAHDFNNLLTVIGGSTELVLERLAPTDRNRRVLQDVRDATARAAQLTQQLLAFGRRQVLQAEVLDLGLVVGSCEQMLRRVIGEHIDLVCRIQRPGLHVRADRSQIEQVIVNLAVNARDAMPGGGRLLIDVDRVEETTPQTAGRVPGPVVRMRFSDDGTGIPADIVPHIFEPFFTTKQVGQGTGLGLATVHGIVQQSGGSIAVDSREGDGTTFTIHLPEVAAAPGVRPDEPQAVSANERAGETVLLVEDEDAVREVTATFLSRAGYRVLSASGGPEALEALAAHGGPLDVLLTDVVMPGMSGPELATRVTASHPEARVLFMSGYPNEALASHRDGRPDAPVLIQKPFSGATLVRAVREAAASRVRSDQVGAAESGTEPIPSRAAAVQPPSSPQ